MDRKKVLILIAILTIIIIFIGIKGLNSLNKTFRYEELVISEEKLEEITKDLEETENLMIVRMDFNNHEIVVDDQTRMIYYSTVNTSSNKYNPIISYEANEYNTKIAILSEKITADLVRSDYRANIVLYNEKEYKIYELDFTDLPQLNIRYDKLDKGNINNVRMYMQLFDNLSNIPETNRYVGSAGRVKERNGVYSFSLEIMSLGHNVRENEISLLNQPKSSDYILTKAIDEEEKKELEELEGKEAEEEKEETKKNKREPKLKNNKVQLFLNSNYKGLYELSQPKRVPKNRGNN